MKTQLKLLALAATLSCTGAMAQTAGTWMARAGVVTISPQVNSGTLTAPDFKGGTKADVLSDTTLGGGITYMLTDNVSVDVPLALPFKHKLVGDGAMAGAGELGSVHALPFVVFLQYRFLEASAKFRPYVGMGATYAYFFNEEGSGKLTATTNPGGSPTKFTVDSKFALTPQVGATFALNDKWFVDVFYAKTFLKTRTNFSTGQTMDIALDPVSYGLNIGYKF